MNFGQLQNLSAYYLDDLNFTYFTKIQIQLWLNNAQQVMNQRLIQAGESWYTTTVQANLVQNQACYLLPSDFLKIVHIEIVLGGVFPNEQKAVLNHSTVGESDYYNYSPGQPITFYVEKNCLVLVPPPDNTYLIRMKYCYRVSDMIFDGETPDVPQEYHESLAIQAAMDGFLKDQRDSSQFAGKREYVETLLKQSAQNRMVDKPRDVVVTWDDGNGAGF